MKKIKLTKEEQEIERDIEAGLYVPASPENRRRLARAIEKSRKEASVSFRISDQDLWELKNLAADEGLPYQTFITSILHKYTTHRLVDERAIRKVVATLKAQ